jgi:subtilase family serine protease
MKKISRLREIWQCSVMLIGVALVHTGTSRAHAQVLTTVVDDNPAIGAEVLQVPGVQDLGRRAGGSPVDVLVCLRFNHEKELDQLIAEQGDPASPNFRKYLTAAQFAERFGPTAEQLDPVTSVLKRAGFQITKISSNRVLIYATAPSSIVENYFKTEIHTVKQDPDADQYMNVTPAFLPDALVPLVLEVNVNNLIVAKAIAHSAAISGPYQGPNAGYTPVALANYFQFPVEVGYDGTGHTAAIMISSDVADSDVNTFLAYFPITRTGTITREIVSGTGGIKKGAAGYEVALDTETIAALAPGANIILYLIDKLSFADIDGAAEKIVSDDTAEVVNMSFAGSQVRARTFFEAVKQGNAEGITFVASSGDDGYQYCGFPAGLPNVLGLGGTFIGDVGPGGTFTLTVAWSSSGGGVSTIYKIPNYQKGVTGLVSTTMRNFPDVAFPAVFTDVVVNGEWTALAGTSWSSPTYVGLQLELNQVKGNRMGLVNNDLYRVFKKSGYTDFIDPSQGGGNDGKYSVGPGYDLITGIGLPLGEPLVLDPNF